MSAMDIDQHDPNGSAAPAGIIYPPPDIRKLIDKAAANLATKGPELENHIRETDKDGRFNFLNPNDPYYAYYRFKYQEVKEGKMPNASSPSVQERPNAAIPQDSIKPAPKEPEQFEFSAHMPAMSAQDLDIMKLTAQFAARNGRAFIGQLAQRESRNYQFDFLRPSHSLFPFFTELVKQYTKVFLPPRDLQQKLKANINNKYDILDRVKERVEWAAYEEAEKQKKNEEDEKERIAYASIDWNDFVVVETVEFTESDEKTELPPPMSLTELESMSLAQKRLAAMPEEPVQEDIEMVEEEPSQLPPPPAASVTVPKVPDTSMPIKIRTDYKPKFLANQTTKSNVPTEICPRCGEAIPVDEMAEHMRIELLDPKWKEQKMAMEAKQRDSNLLQEGQDVAKILKNMSNLRPDIFGSDEVDANKRIREKEEEAKKKDRVIWDGHTATMALANQRAQKTNMEDQMAQLQQRMAEDNIGPQLPGQAPTHAAPPVGYPQYYNQAPMYSTPGMYNMPAPNIMAPPMAPMAPMAPPITSIPPSANLTPVVRKHEDSEAGPDKKPRVDEGEAEVVPDNSFGVLIQTPHIPDKPEWHLNGSVVRITGLLPNTLISTVKDRITSQLGMPAGKQKLSIAPNVVLNNSKTLSFYGIHEGHTLILEVKKK